MLISNHPKRLPFSFQCFGSKSQAAMQLRNVPHFSDLPRFHLHLYSSVGTSAGAWDGLPFHCIQLMRAAASLLA